MAKRPEPARRSLSTSLSLSLSLFLSFFLSDLLVGVDEEVLLYHRNVELGLSVSVCLCVSVSLCFLLLTWLFNCLFPSSLFWGFVFVSIPSSRLKLFVLLKLSHVYFRFYIWPFNPRWFLLALMARFHVASHFFVSDSFGIHFTHIVRDSLRNSRSNSFRISNAYFDAWKLLGILGRNL